MGSSILGTLMLLSATAALAQSNAAAATGCGELVTIETHDRTTTVYALAYPQPAPPQGARVGLVLRGNVGPKKSKRGRWFKCNYWTAGQTRGG